MASKEQEADSGATQGCSRCRSEAEPSSPKTEATRPPARGWLSSVAALPAALLPLLPSFTCPACIAAYAGVLSAMGLGFVLRESVLTPLIVVALAISVLTIARATRSHKKPLPLVLTVAASVAIILGRLVWELPVLVYAGGATLLLASFYNLWLKRPRKRALGHTAASV